MPGTEKVFGDDGEEIDPSLADIPGDDEVIEDGEVTDETENEETDETEETPATPKAKGKYRIGDQEFDTMEAAHAYATQADASADDNDAYRRIVHDALRANPAPESVTPAAEEIDEVQLFENPKEFLKKFKQDVQRETIQSIDQTAAEKANSDAIWRSFTDRHPALADFRNEAEMITGTHLKVVQNLVKTKGQAAAYDFIALKMREDFSRKANALKPTRQLNNKGSNTTPSGKTGGVTPKKVEKKPLSFSEQIRSIKKRKQ